MKSNLQVQGYLTHVESCLYDALKNTPHSCPPKQTGIYNAIFLDVLIQILRYTRQIKA